MMDEAPEAAAGRSTRHLVVMGVAGVGKTTVGRLLAERLGWPFVDADAFHPAANVAKMKRGEPLTDADRAPWLAALRALLAQHAAEGQPLVLACSALRAAYRDVLADGGPIAFVHLYGSSALIRTRMEARDHFMPPGLLASQFEALEPPENALTLSVEAPPAALVEAIVGHLGLR